MGFTLVYVDDVSTSQEPYVWALTACCGDNFAFLYEDALRT
jgi:hypothetical protein